MVCSCHMGRNSYGEGSVCWSGLRVPIAYSLLGGGVPIPEQRLCWIIDSFPLRFKNHYVLYLL